MKRLVNIPAKKIIATEPQVLIHLKLRYNAIIDKLNTMQVPENKLERLLTQASQLHTQIGAYS